MIIVALNHPILIRIPYCRDIILVFLVMSITILCRNLLPGLIARSVHAMVKWIKGGDRAAHHGLAFIADL